jgi:hypothetical protein
VLNVTGIAIFHFVSCVNATVAPLFWASVPLSPPIDDSNDDNGLLLSPHCVGTTMRHLCRSPLSPFLLVFPFERIQKKSDKRLFSFFPPFGCGLPLISSLVSNFGSLVDTAMESDATSS